MFASHILCEIVVGNLAGIMFQMSCASSHAGVSDRVKMIYRTVGSRQDFTNSIAGFVGDHCPDR